MKNIHRTIPKGKGADRNIMITRTDIKQETNSVTYSRGYRIWQEGGVYDLQVEEVDSADQEADTRVTANVRGSGGNTYRVKIALNDKDGEILSDDCECPAHEKYWGLCKHCVAVALGYMDWRKAIRREREKKAEEEARIRRSQEQGTASGETLDTLLASIGVRKGMDFLQEAVQQSTDFRNPAAVRENRKIKRASARTSPGLTELMANYAMRDKASYLPKAKSGQVRLEVRVSFLYRELKAEFKIGIQRMYVLKSISQFAAAVQNLEQVSYGVGFSFLHCMEAFAPECRKMVRYLIEQAKAKKTLYITPYGKWYSYEADRFLHLEEWTVDGFMDALQDLDFKMGTELDAERMGVFEEGRPKLELTISGKKNAIQLQAPPFRFFEGKNFTYFFTEGKIFRESNENLGGVMVFFRYLQERAGNICTISGEDFPVFCQNLLPELERLFTVKKESAGLTDCLVPEVSFEIYLDLMDEKTAGCVLLAVYGEQKYNVFRDMNSIWEMARGRDVKREMEVYTKLLPYFSFYEEGQSRMMIQGEEALYELLTAGLEEMRECGEVFLSETLKAVRVYPSPGVSAGVALEGNLLEMTFGSEELSAEELAAILSRYDRKKKYYRLKNGDFVNMEEGMLQVLAGMRKQLGLTEKEMKSGKIRLPGYRAVYVDGCFQEEGIPIDRDRKFRALIRSMKTVEENDFEIPANLNAKLRPYQETGFRWMKTMCQNGFGGILADDMGLGKTLQVITFLLSEISEAEPGERKRTLIVTPASLVYNWKSELGRFAPSLVVCVIAGTTAERRKQIRSLGEQEIAVTSYDLLKRDLEEYREIPFFCEVLDEAQFIKNHATQGAKAVREIQAGFRLALTGTPVENRLSELWSIFDYLMPGFLYGYQKFREEMEVPIVRGQDQEALSRLQKMIRPFILRRLKKDVLKDLPDKIEKNMFADMGKEQKELYLARAQKLAMELGGQSEQEFRDSRMKILAEITHLRQICCDPALLYEAYPGESAKTRLCMELVKNALEGGHRILLFSQFTTMLEILVKEMQKEKIPVFVLNGSTPKEERMRLAEGFQKGEASVFCISLKAGGTGLNLTGADMVIHFDPWWNAAAENQATDRAHRIGQKHVVTVYRLIVRGTIEEKILGLQEAKKELAEQVLAGEELKTAAFTREELLELLEDI